MEFSIQSMKNFDVYRYDSKEIEFHYWLNNNHYCEEDDDLE